MSRSIVFPIARTLMLFGLMLVGCPTPAATPLKAGILVIPPFGIPEKDTGIYYDMFTEMAKQSDLPIEKVFLSRTLLPIALKEGQIDLAISLPYPEAQEYAECATTLYHSNLQVIPRSKFKLKKISDLNQLSDLIIAKGTYLAQPLNDTTFHFNRHVVKDYDIAFKRMLRDQVDAVYGTQIGLQYSMKMQRVPEIFVGKPLNLEAVSVCLNVSKHSQQRPLINTQLLPVVQKMASEHVFEKIIDDFLLKVSFDLPTNHH